MRLSRIRVVNFRSIRDSNYLSLGQINVIIGRNNAGKSSLLRAVYQLQQNAPWADSDIRLGQSTMQLLAEAEEYDLRAVGVNRRFDRCSVVVERSANQAPAIVLRDNQGNIGVTAFPSTEPDNIIYPSLSGRVPPINDEQVRKAAASDVSPTDYNLISRYATLSDPRTPHGGRFAELCERVLGVNLSLLTSTNGQRIGTSVGRFTDIGLQSMGTGISTVLGLLINLTDAVGKIFLIEEPENDLHPQALKVLLDVIIEGSEKNQFIITTHSNIVLTRLGAQDPVSVIEAVSDGGSPPTSSFKLIEGHADRLRVLRDLGYELADLGLSWGWVIFEESSAERLCRDYFIKWFAPSLLMLNTIAAQGAGNVPSLTQHLIDMMKFAHLEPAYRFRAWVLVDGDRAGIDAIVKLREKSHHGLLTILSISMKVIWNPIIPTDSLSRSRGVVPFAAKRSVMPSKRYWKTYCGGSPWIKMPRVLSSNLARKA